MCRCRIMVVSKSILYKWRYQKHLKPNKCWGRRKKPGLRLSSDATVCSVKAPRAGTWGQAWPGLTRGLFFILLSLQPSSYLQTLVLDKNTWIFLTQKIPAIQSEEKKRKGKHRSKPIPIQPQGHPHIWLNCRDLLQVCLSSHTAGCSSHSAAWLPAACLPYLTHCFDFCGSCPQ